VDGTFRHGTGTYQKRTLEVGPFGWARGEDMRVRGRQQVGVVAALAPVLAAVLATLLASAAPVLVRAPVPAPAIVLVVSDDQRLDQMFALPLLRDLLAERSVVFDRAFVTNPWCCPSRATILTGNYSHTTGVYRNAPPYGGFDAFRAPGAERATVATRLRAAGWRTGLFGKYLNGYRGTYVPPGWSRWVAFHDATNEGGAYVDYELNVDGVLESHGSTESDYSTDLLADRTVEFIRGTTAATPLFAFFSPFAPHELAVPATRHAGLYASHVFPRPPSFNEADVRDKPAYIRGAPLLTATKIASMERGRRNALATLAAVDEAVARIRTALVESGRLERSVILFISDNGFLRGEHRYLKKIAPYEENIRVPFAIHAPGLITGPSVHRSRLVLNTDVAPTVLGLADVPAGPTDGASLVPFLEGRTPVLRSSVLLEHMKGGAGDPVPSYCGLRTATHKYVYYGTGERELYDLRADPFELLNIADRPDQATLLHTLHADLVRQCSPAPPEMTLPPS
jgi:arylsulfatase A-like enzyme